ncbi:Glyoxalase-like domain-containing protein [Streptomyces sp. SceaMP-e96]|uniref:VOC family protein n=1 Tax=unclassified Streptomyces TaxID=2593676 RepID=UPI000823B951|nr:MULTISPECIES: VOC family protein [unclassified Streptomyces]MYT12814.1 VOC family protein [Streptomyces sp. SID4951]MYT15807.1 VOC family protein [Streptomyces sp. SID4951]MYT16192.1 VOC family protein [Streptomyces sp. SID4951]MYT16528.1 VOC family protein [Streptomyces sp. SID4951]SCK24744.1 Glyoxalase-like domain-containing protein [Streptomyces sp. SceaMP-e96]
MDMTLQLSIDCSDPQKLVSFWAEALGYVPEPPPGGHATWRAYWAETGVPEAELPTGAGETPESIIDPAGRGPRVWFQPVPEPKAAKNRVHLDLKVGGGRDVPLAVRTQRVTAKVEQLAKAGATVLRIMDEPDMGYYAVVLQDPEGNEFCVV